MEEYENPKETKKLPNEIVEAINERRFYFVVRERQRKAHGK